MKILVTDSIALQGIDILRQRGIAVNYRRL